MGINTGSNVGNLTSAPASGSPSLLRSAGTAVFDFLDAPRNITAAGIGFVQTGDTDYLKNIAYNILPGPDARRIPGSEITGATSYGGKLLSEFIDPTLVISGIGTATKAGMLGKIAVTSAKRARLAKLMQKTSKGVAFAADDLTDILKAAELDATAYRAEKALQLKEFVKKGGKAADFKVKKRGLVSVGVPFYRGMDINLGEFDRVAELAQRYSLMPDPKIMKLGQQAERLEIESRRLTKRAGRLGDRDKKAIKMLDDAHAKQLKAKHLRDEALGLHQGVIPIEMAAKIRNKIGKAKVKMSSKSDIENLNIIRELTKTQIAKGMHHLGEEGALLQSRIEELAKAAGETADAMNIRITRAGEARDLAPDILSRTAEKNLVKDIKAAKKEAKKRYSRTSRAFIKQENKLKKSKLGPVEKHQKLRKLYRKNIEAEKTIKEKFSDAVFEAKERITHREMQIGRHEEILGKMSPEEMALTKSIYEELQAFVKLAKPLGIKIDELQSSNGFLSFVPRLPTEQAKALKKSGDKRYNLIIKDFKERLSGAHRRKLYPESDIDLINKEMRDIYNIDFDFFDTNVAKQIVVRKAEHIKALHKALGVQAAIKTTLGKEGIAAKKIFKSLGLDAAAAPKGKIPTQVANFLLGNADLYSPKKQEQFLTGAFRTIDNITQMWRIPLTVFHPAFHHRNMVWNMIISKANGGSFRKIKEAAILQWRVAKGTASQAEMKLWDELIGMRVAGGRTTHATQMDEFVRAIEGSKWQEWADRPLSKIVESVGLKSKDTKTVFDFGTGRAYGAFIEDNARIAHYMAMRAKGLNKFESMREVNRILFDYSDLTLFEQQKLRPLFTFYTWTRKNLPLMLKTVITNPRLGATYAKITGMGEEELPNWMRGTGFAFQAPEFLFGKNQALASLGLGLEDLFIFNVGDADPAGNRLAGQHEIQRFADKILARTAPPIQIPMQLLTGRQFFTGRSLKDIPIGKQLLQASPISRFGGTIEKFFDEDKSYQARIVDFMTGARLYPFDPKKVRIDKMKRTLKATGRFRESKFLVPRDKHDKTAKKLLKKLRKEIAKGG